MPQRPLILLVDRDPDTRQILRDVLEHEGYEVVESATGRRGLKLARRHTPDLIIGDFPLDVPGHSSFTEDIRRDPALTHTRILVVTARAMDAERAAAEAVGDAVLVKPVVPMAVVAEVRALLRGA